MHRNDKLLELKTLAQEVDSSVELYGPIAHGHPWEQQVCRNNQTQNQPHEKTGHTLAWPDAAFERKRTRFRSPQCLRNLMQLLDIWRGKSWEAKGTSVAFLQHMTLLKPFLEDCFLLSHQHCGKDIRKVKDVFKTDTWIIWRPDNFLTNSILFYLYSKEQQETVARISRKPRLETEVIINWHNFSRNMIIHLTYEMSK